MIRDLFSKPNFSRTCCFPEYYSHLKNIDYSLVWFFPSMHLKGIYQYQWVLPSLYTSWTRHFLFRRRRKIGTQQRRESNDRIEYCLRGFSECNSIQQCAQPSMNMVLGQSWGSDKIRTSWAADLRWPRPYWGEKGERIVIWCDLSRNCGGFRKIVDDTCEYETGRGLHVVISY